MVTILICVVILTTGGGDALFSMSSFGYTSGYEGVSASFAGLQYNAGDSHGKESLSGTSFYFDPDDPVKFAPNLIGEMTNAFVPEKSVKPGWVFEDLWKGSQYIKNPVSVSEWNLPNPDNANETISYVMEEWILRMYLSVTAEWDEFSGITWGSEHENSGGTRYTNSMLWVELDIRHRRYFEGADAVHFGIGKVVTSDVAFGVLGKTDEDYSPTGGFSVAPKSATSYRYLYYSKYGASPHTPTDPQSYQGRVLNPEIFVERMFFNVELGNFGTERSGNPFTGFNYKGDAVTWGFDVHVFVVGEWKVQDIEEIPDEYGRSGQVSYGWGHYLERFLADPRGQFWMLIGFLAVVFLLLAVFAPGVLVVMFGAFGARGGRKK